ncbi:MAG: transcription antitermination factor NusB [Planctomycetaceae bacterium]|jgi:N utilization substance protein B|nr:transcription antitermination factor NusB [Planctomycetaceae bacterium]
MFFEEDDFYVPTSGKFANRSRARAAAFQILYQEELNPRSSQSRWVDTFLEQELPDHEEVLRFARTLIEGVRKNQPELDRQIAEQSRNWSLSRMSVTDRNILRQSLYELLYLETPKPVVISQAIELARSFGSNDSAAFVNGILDRFNKTKVSPNQEE